MKTTIFAALLLLTVPAIAADAPPAEPKPSVQNELKNLVIEDAKKQAANPTTAAANTAATAAAAPSLAPAPSPMAPATPPLSSTTPPPAPEPVTPKPPAPEPTTALPKVEVRSRRITEMDLKIRQQEKDIAREQKNTKASDLDQTLNDSKTSKLLSIFGGQSAESREGFAQQRVELMEAEKEIMEAIAQTKDKARKDELQKQLVELKSARRDLEKSMR